MKTEILLILITFMFLGKANAETVLPAQATQPTQIMSTISWKQYHLIEIAMTTIKKKKIDVIDYQITVSEDEKVFIVDFFNPNPRPPPPPPKVIRFGEPKRGFRIRISKIDLKIIQTSYLYYKEAQSEPTKEP